MSYYEPRFFMKLSPSYLSERNTQRCWIVDNSRLCSSVNLSLMVSLQSLHSVTTFLLQLLVWLRLTNEILAWVELDFQNTTKTFTRLNRLNRLEFPPQLMDNKLWAMLHACLLHKTIKGFSLKMIPENLFRLDNCIKRLSDKRTGLWPTETKHQCDTWS